MPIYEYKCTECDHISEKIESFKSEIRTIICPFCNGISNRILSLGSFQLKGDGWYKDGYERKRTDRSGAGGSGGDGKGTPEPQIETESNAEASE